MRLLFDYPSPFLHESIDGRRVNLASNTHKACDSVGERNVDNAINTQEADGPIDVRIGLTSPYILILYVDL